jgi:Cu/Ag efflux pump CusA
VLGLSCRALLHTLGGLLDLERREETDLTPELVARATGERFAPMLASALGTTALLLPAAVAVGATGFDVLRPAALAFIGGMVTTTVVVLFVVPALHLRLGSGPDRDTWVEDLYEPETTDLTPVKA